MEFNKLSAPTLKELFVEQLENMAEISPLLLISPHSAAYFSSLSLLPPHSAKS